MRLSGKVTVQERKNNPIWGLNPGLNERINFHSDALLIQKLQKITFQNSCKSQKSPLIDFASIFVINLNFSDCEDIKHMGCWENISSLKANLHSGEKFTYYYNKILHENFKLLVLIFVWDLNLSNNSKNTIPILNIILKNLFMSFEKKIFDIGTVINFSKIWNSNHDWSLKCWSLGIKPTIVKESLFIFPSKNKVYF